MKIIKETFYEPQKKKDKKKVLQEQKFYIIFYIIRLKNKETTKIKKLN